MTEQDEEAPHILVVDDDPRLRQLLHRYLVQNGYFATTAADAIEAKSKAKNMAFDLIVLDIMMPGQDGLSLTEELRGESEVPIMLLTARGAPEDRIRGLEAGADDYLAKPFEPRELLLRVATILRRVQVARTDDVIRFGPFTFNRRNAELRRPRRRDPPDHRRDLASPGAGSQARSLDQPRRARRQGRGGGLRSCGRRADGPAAPQDRGRPPPATLHPHDARLRLCAAAGELSPCWDGCAAGWAT